MMMDKTFFFQFIIWDHVNWTKVPINGKEEGLSNDTLGRYQDTLGWAMAH